MSRHNQSSPEFVTNQEPLNLSPNQRTLNRIKSWLAIRLPTILRVYRRYTREYFVPKNLNIWYVFGALALLTVSIQVLTGLALAMHYRANTQQAFISIEHIMRDVWGGAWIRYAHSTGASALFVLLYLHIARGLLYGSYRKPRELVWLIGCVLFMLIIIQAFIGYLLPWGQMSYWGAQVVTNLLANIPWVGPDLAILVRGGDTVGDATLTRFFVMHAIGIPLLLVGWIVLHVVTLHDAGSSNPAGVDVYKGSRGNQWSATAPSDTVPFHPYYTVRDLLAGGVFMTIFLAIVFFAPEMGGYFLEQDNFIAANPLVTPQHIAPMWYFRPFYSMLRSMTLNMTTSLAVIIWCISCWSVMKGHVVKRKRWLLPICAMLLALLLGLIPGLLQWTHAPASLTQWWYQVAKIPQDIAIIGRLWWLLCMGIDPSFWGLATLAASVLILCALPWLDRSPVRSIRCRPRWHHAIYWSFAAVFLFLGIAGGMPLASADTVWIQLGTTLYFAFFLLMPWWSRQGAFRAVPQQLPVRHRSLSEQE